MTLPKGWAEATIAEITTINPKHPNDADRSQSVSFVPMPAVDEHLGAITGATDRPLEEIWTGYTHFADGDVIFAKITPCMENGKAAVASGLTNGLACGSTEFYVLRSQDGIDCHYLWRFLRQDWFRAEAEKHMSGAVGQRRVPRLYLEEYSLPLPPAAEQRRIVAKLDALTARIARARAELDRVPALTERMRLRAIRDVFGKFGDEEILRIDELCKVGTGATPKRGESRYYKNGSIAWVTSGAVNSLVVMSPNEFITPVAIRETNCKVYPAGSLLVALYGEGKTRGKVAKLGIDAATNQALAVLHAFDTVKIVPHWIKLFLEARYEETRQEAAGGVQPNLNLGIIKEIRIPVPSLEEQRDGVEQVAILRARADRLESEAARARALLDRLESSILAKAFRGELVPQDDNDEPASVLLERIRAQRAVAPKKTRVARRSAPG